MKQIFLLLAALATISIVHAQNQPLQRPQAQKPHQETSQTTNNSLQWNESTQELVCGKNRYRMITVKGGTFRMGATPDQGTVSSNEKPAHNVTVKDFAIGQTEVPQWLWMAVMGNNPSKWIGVNLPVEQVCWHDCQKFLARLNKLTGLFFALPTEAQWEYAARGGKKSNAYKYSGSNNANDVAWISTNGNAKTHRVATKSPNELGLYDMSGNVYEWCQNHWSTSYSATPDTNHYAIRGGSWKHQINNAKVSVRKYGVSPNFRKSYIGFRIILQ